MKKIILIIAIMSLFSCQEGFIDGKITDTIGMERNEIVFGPKNDTVTFKTKGNNYVIHPDGEHFKETYVNTALRSSHDTLHYDWVKVVALKDEYTVKVIVFDNETGSGRNYEARLQDKGYFGHLKIYQNSK